jgi:hypothetical protein
MLPTQLGAQQGLNRFFKASAYSISTTLLQCADSSMRQLMIIMLTVTMVRVTVQHAAALVRSRCARCGMGWNVLKEVKMFMKHTLYMQHICL